MPHTTTASQDVAQTSKQQLEKKSNSVWHAALCHADALPAVQSCDQAIVKQPQVLPHKVHTTQPTHAAPMNCQPLPLNAAWGC
jgi:hypothetical protein